MPGSMWDMGAPPQRAPPAYHQDGLGTQRASMWDQGPNVPQPSTQPSQSMWDQGAPRHPGQPTPTVQPMNRPPAAVVARPTQAPLMGPQGPLTGNIKKGTVKSYSVVKGFGFILAPDIPQDIYFGRDSLQADLRTSDVAGTQVTFELTRAPDGKPQGRNLRPIGNAPPTAAQMQHGNSDVGTGNADGRGGMEQMRPMGPAGGCPHPQVQAQGCWPGKGMMCSPPMNPMGMGMGCFSGKGQQGCINPAFLGKPGFPPMLPSAGAACFSRPSFPMMPGQMHGQIMPGMMRPGMPGFVGMMRPGMPGAGGCFGQPGMINGRPAANRQRDWSPHAGSRAIRSAIKPASEEGATKAARSKSKSSSRSRSRSRSRRSSSSKSSSRSRSRKNKKKKKKKHKKNKKGRSSSTISSSSSGKNKDKSGDPAGGDDADKAAASGENPDIQKAKMEALAKLREMQSVEPKEERSKQFRALLREWHPDKNPEKTEVATAVFQFLQKGKNLLNLK